MNRARGWSVICALILAGCGGSTVAGTAAPAATSSQASALTIGPETPDGHFGGDTKGWCQCEAWCESNLTCGNQHRIDCNVADVTNNAACGEKCSGIKDHRDRCEKRCGKVHDIRGTYVTTLDPLYKNTCVK